MAYGIMIQGMAADMSQANGDYDSSFEYQVNTPEELLDVIRRVAPLQTPPHPPDADVCPPNLVVNVGSEQFWFMPEGGQLFCENAGGYVTPEQALQLITTPGGAAMARQAVQQQEGTRPVRMAHIPPTDGANFSVDYVNTGPQMPQVHFGLMRSHDAKTNPVVFWVTAVVLMGFGLVMAGTAAVGPGAIVFAFGAVAAWAAKRSGANITHLARVGFDWNWNVLWSVVGDATFPSYLTDANLIVDVIGVRRIAPGLGKECFEVFVPGQHTSGSTIKGANPWDLRFPDVNGDWLILDIALTFHDVVELNHAINTIRGLLASQP